MEQLFVYGTLRQPSIVKQVIGRALYGIPATLRGYRKKTIHYYGGDCFVIISDTKSSVKGKILFVTKRELRLFDDHEYCIYLRKRVRLTNGQQAWTYALRDEQRFL